ncbi:MULTISPECIES: ribonuclease D [Acinetobacter]|uniref:ribonuclease D n=1 Tax=Acinetobacter TaxID=469 RepID=UPI0005C50D4B|nr:MULTISPECIES: ribonuclease D [Acinetobacter]EJB8459116.1 ribonuclease D [Acinetobacter baumannii]EJB8474877.1 ribonuclease D [Acinetobacter baumannii]EJB8549511.1 ribonuclease D [Acinetobacter baumannii]EJB8566663.1 ribonuclease D [Acinetobacter baumannii]MDS7956757.1 ribonuclease D [Acinetobacter sp. V104_13]
MTRDEAIKLLDCQLCEMADKLQITTAAVAKWNKNKIPAFREYQIRELAAGRIPIGLTTEAPNLSHANN